MLFSYAMTTIKTKKKFQTFIFVVIFSKKKTVKKNWLFKKDIFVAFSKMTSTECNLSSESEYRLKSTSLPQSQTDMQSHSHFEILTVNGFRLPTSLVNTYSNSVVSVKLLTSQWICRCSEDVMMEACDLTMVRFATVYNLNSFCFEI